MPNTIITPNMGLTLPIPGAETGPQYASDNNGSFTTVDGHNHTPGNGVQIPTAGISINADFPLNGFNLVSANSTEFVNLGSPLAGSSPFLNTIYVSGGNLYFNDSAGNQVKITASGAVNATSSGISSGTATASFSGGVLVVNSNVNTPANIQAGSILIGNNVANSKYVTLQAPSSLGANYSLTLPPSNGGGTAFLTIDSSNNMNEGPLVANGITASNIANATITTTQLAASVVNALSPTGSVTMYGGTSAPTGWQLCDGTALNRTTFAALFAAIGTAYGNGDGSTTFNVPDMRGLFPRGVTGASGNDPDAASRTAVNGGNTGNNVGSFQADQNKAHNHTLKMDVNPPDGLGSNFYVQSANSPDSSPSLINAAAATIQNSGGNQSNPKNLYFNFIIKT
jgi:microcystin-dependent protein